MLGKTNTYKFISISNLRKKGFLIESRSGQNFSVQTLQALSLCQGRLSFSQNQADRESLCQAHSQGANSGCQSSEWGWWLVPRFQFSYLTNESYGLTSYPRRKPILHEQVSDEETISVSMILTMHFKNNWILEAFDFFSAMIAVHNLSSNYVFLTSVNSPDKKDN